MINPPMAHNPRYPGPPMPGQPYRPMNPPMMNPNMMHGRPMAPSPMMGHQPPPFGGHRMNQVNPMGGFNPKPMPPAYSVVPPPTNPRVRQEDLGFGTYCEHCKKKTGSIRKKTPTTWAYVFCVVFLFLFCPLFWVPFCIDDYYTVTATCQECGNVKMKQRGSQGII